MAEGFEPYHVPQQSRRDKLRVGGTSSGMDGAASSSLLPLYDPSLLPSDFISCAAAAAGFHNPNHPIDTEAADQGCKSDPPHPLVKEEGPYQHYLHRIYTNQQSSMAVNPSTVANMNSGDGNNPFLCPSTHFRDFAQSFHSNSSNSALALSLSSHGHDSNPSSRHHSSLSLPLELNLQRYGSTTISTAGGYLIPTVATDVLQVNEAASRSSGLLGPFTGYTTILKGSRFLKPTQQLLEELCDVGHNPPEKMMVDVSMVEGLSNGETSSNSLSNCGDEGEFSRKKCRLISMLEEVCRRYRQYYQQMQDVVESFEYVAGFGNAAPYANLAVKAMSKHFRCLKNAITDQLQLNNKECTRENPNKSKAESPTLRSNDGVQYGQRLSSSGYLEHQPIWRPQRGLPERAVTVLRAWLFDHFLHPYPTDTDKIMLAKQTGLSRSQVSNWFINARVRLWKPMVEEIHMLETQQGQKSLQREERSNNPSTRATPDFPNLVNSLPSETPSTSTQQGHEAPHKRTRNNLPDVSMRNDERHFPYELSNAHHHHQQLHPSFGEGINGVNNSVSLTLGLHQNNNGMSLSEPFQVNDVQRYDIGLEGSNNEGYVIGGFEAQHRHFARDLYGGQLLHDFVG